ncbi:hypothetical protein [Pseudomonas leptonychotis]|uniref:hypothetical protein n=1 Tax=Pseudomonas leptonychotis TaxID=2448482 RepID=UPI00386320C1
MDQEIALFIGGPCDGQRRKVYVGQPRAEAVNLPIRRSPSISIDANPPREAVAFTSAIYDRCAVRSPQGTDTAVYVYGDIDPMAALIACYREPSDARKREQIEDLGWRDEHVHAILSALRAGMLNSYKDALEEMVIVLAEKSAMYEKQLMQLHGTLLRDMTSPLGVFIGNQGEQRKPDPL